LSAAFCFDAARNAAGWRVMKG